MSVARQVKSRKRVWTAAEVRALGTRTDVPTAFEILTGRGRDAAYRSVKRGDFPVPIIRIGEHQMVVPVQPILELLCLTSDMGSAAPAPPGPAGQPVNASPLSPRDTPDDDSTAGCRRSA